MESSGPTRWAEHCRVFREETGVALPSGGSIFKLHGAALLDGCPFFLFQNVPRRYCELFFEKNGFPKSAAEVV